jgi:predicted transcriptional regulator
MRRSKLESYEDILEALVKKPLTIDNIAYETNMNCPILTQRLDFLMKYGLVQERSSSKKKLYGITERGIAVFKTLNFQKYLEKVANTIRAMDDAFQVLSTILEPNDKKQNQVKETKSY